MVSRFLSHPQLLLLLCLFGAGANSLFFAFIYQPQYNHLANLWAVLVFWSLAGWVYFQRQLVLISHLALLTAMALMTYITWHTGGINSPAMVWMSILAVPALLLLNRRAALIWLGLILVVCLIEFWAVMQGWISGDVLKDVAIIPWVLTDKINVAISLILAVNFYDRLHHQQITALADSNQALEQTQQALRQAQSHKDEFIASVGHELRTPMNAILGLNGVLMSELADQPENAHIAQLIGESTQQLLGLVNDILDFSQLEAGRLVLSEKPVLLSEGLLHMLKAHDAKAKSKHLQLHVHWDERLPTAVLLDPLRLKQVLDNLMDNAVKFTDVGQISIRVLDASRFIRFEIQDSGRGIALERQAEVFKRFEHADVQTNRAYGGTGLGLAICERLVTLQGGRIGVQSSPGLGALFWFELPLKPVQLTMMASQVEPGTVQQSAAYRFLLVDDNAVNLMVASLVIQKYWTQSHLTTAGSGEQALQLLATQDFDVVLMDMVMPGMDGLQTTRHIRQHPRQAVADLVVIGLTANNTLKDREACLQAGMNDVLTKPMDGAAVQTTLQHWLAWRATSGGSKSTS